MSKINIILYAIIIICFYDICDAEFDKFQTFEKIKFSESGDEITNFIIGNIKFSNEFMYCNFPRTNNALQFTFTIRHIDRKDEVFLPYPNQTLNEFEKNNCSRLISVISFEIDKDDNLYILDEGKYNNSRECPPKLIIYNKGNEIQKYELNESIIYKKNLQLEDILIDQINNYIYISYHENNANGIFLMHNDTNQKIKKLLYNDSRLNEENGYIVHIKGKERLPKDKKKIKSMGLSCDGEAFFFCFITSKMIYSILTKEIYQLYKGTQKDEIKIEDISIHEAYKNDSTSAIIYSNMGNLFLTGLENNKIYSYDLIDNDLSRFDYKGLRQLNTDEDIIFPDKMTIYDGKIYLLTSDLNSSNYTIYYDTIEEKSYIYGCAGLKYQFNLSFYIMLGIFFLILLFVITFVIVGNIQDKDINKKNN